ncbi:MAG: radical SAM family heme chaperone HemW [Kiritimatiellae bacterium]|nr:radical SAM family heme chaperone HemW [Kiritimatiellia bacterium]
MNLYVHFPFCRKKCAYCALHSHAGRSESERKAYVDKVSRDIESLFAASANEKLSTVYFGGGTPALCDLSGLLETISRREKDDGFEFTVELNPLDVTPSVLNGLKKGGVNRISMGVQSFHRETLLAMQRPHDAAQAIDAWKMIRDAGFENAGFDLICGWPDSDWTATLETAVSLRPDHCSIYTLILEPGTVLSAEVESGKIALPSDDVALGELAAAEQMLKTAGLERYEISNFSKPGKECRHNLATWRGEDYTGIGEGACSREGNAVSRVIFRLRLLKEGFSPSAAAMDFPELAPRVQEWTNTLDSFADQGLLTSVYEANGSPTYRLTPRGAEVCDTILAELV